MKLQYAARSDMGRVRGNNEDNLYCAGVTLTQESRNVPFTVNDTAALPCVFAVCDGMGGQEDGEFASLTAVRTLAGCAERVQSAQTEELDAIVQEYVANANNLLCTEMRERSVRMGTTLALAVIREDGIHAYSIGDSRIYALSGDTFRQISEDHTLAAPKIKMGLLTDEEARKSSDWHKLSAYLGVFENELELYADVIDALSVDVKTRLLLCSDGVTDMVIDDRIEDIMRTSETAALAAEALLNEALENGGKDNTTCIVADIGYDYETDTQAEAVAAETEPESPIANNQFPVLTKIKGAKPRNTIFTKIPKLISNVRKVFKK